MPIYREINRFFYAFRIFTPFACENKSALW